MLVATSCGDGPLRQHDAQESGRGRLELLITDAPIEGLTAVLVCFDRVEVTFADQQEPVVGLEAPGTFDLLQLQGGVTASLGIAELPTGLLQQIRVVICEEGSTVVVDGVEHPLRIPSGEESGLKLTRPGGFEIRDNVTTTVTADFDAAESVHFSPGQGYILRPVVRLLDALVVVIADPMAGSLIAPGPLEVTGTARPLAGDHLESVMVNGTLAGLTQDTWAAQIEVPPTTGGYTITVEAVTAAGFRAVVDVDVVVDAEPPAVQLVSPNADRALVGSMLLQANATDNYGLDRVEILVDDTLLAAFTSPPFVAVFDSGALDNGPHRVRAVAVDLVGNTATTTEVIVEVANAAGFALTSLDPVQGAPGTIVSLRGNGFSPVVTENHIDFGGVAATVLSATTTTLRVAVPPAATSGRVSVDVGAAAAVSDAEFLVLDPGFDYPKDLVAKVWGRVGDAPKIAVKFREGSRYKAVDGLLASDGIDDLAGVLMVISDERVQRVSPVFDRSAGELRDRSERLERRSGTKLRDLSQYFSVTLRPGASAAEVVEALNARLDVEVAHPSLARRPEPTGDLEPETPPLYDRQVHLLPAPAGIDVSFAALQLGGFGELAHIFHVGEIDVGETHEDLVGAFSLPNGIAANTIADPSACGGGEGIEDDAVRRAHATAVAGIVLADRDRFGVTGIAPRSPYTFVSHPYTEITGSSPSLIDHCGMAQPWLLALEQAIAGDVVFTATEHYKTNDCGGARAANPVGGPLELEPAVRAAIEQLVANGVHVVEGSGNAGPGEDLENPDCYGSLFNSDVSLQSGAMVVGAAHLDEDRAYRWEEDTNFGRRVDLFGPSRVFTTYPPMYPSTAVRPDAVDLPRGCAAADCDPRQGYGTLTDVSAAVPVIAGAVALMESIAEAITGTEISPPVMRLLLAASGTPEADGVAIGRLPNLGLAISGTSSPAQVVLLPPQLPQDAEPAHNVRTFFGGDLGDTGVDTVVMVFEAALQPEVDLGFAAVFVGNAERLDGPTEATAALVIPTIAESVPDGPAPSFAGLGDVNGDGFDDFAVGVPASDRERGTVAIFFGSTDYSRAAEGGEPPQFVVPPDIQLDGARDDGGRFGFVVAAADLDDDGTTDLAIGEPGVGVVYLFIGPIAAGAATFLEPDFVVRSTDTTLLLGKSVATVDIHGDGTADWLAVGGNSGQSPG
ncbi:MAG: hypothetical protein A2138_05535, partial [Deltaproteobacteria bacterium RBG_16_71_12]